MTISVPVPSHPVLSIVIPVRCHDQYDMVERLEARKALPGFGVQVVVVDDGSPEPFPSQVRALCARHGFDYVRLEDEFRIFSLSASRNEGLRISRAPFVLQSDVDVIEHEALVKQLLREIALWEEQPFPFLTVPVAYLNEAGSKVAVAEGFSPSVCDRLWTHVLLDNPRLNGPRGADSLLEHYVPASSLLLAPREEYFAVGGYDESITGWGGEDRDLVFRLLWSWELKQRPRHFYNTKPWRLVDTTKYQGWRALYTLIGGYLERKAAVGFHLYHPRGEWRRPETSEQNITYAAEKASDMKNGRAPIPMLDPRGSKPVAIIGKNPHLLNPAVLRTIGNALVIQEETCTPEQLVEQLRNEGIERVYTTNPFGTAWRTAAVRALRTARFEVVVCERGALPNTLYFDPNGFCSESTSYHESLWRDRTVDSDHLARLRDELRYGSTTLEKNAPRIGGSRLKMKLFGRDPAPQRIVFIALQSPEDTTTRLFAGQVGTYDKYIDELKRLCEMKPLSMRILYKNHPISLTQVTLPNAVCVDEYHVHDILEISDVVVTLNSGVGVLGMLFDTPTLHFGTAFYTCPGLAWPVSTAEEALRLVDEAVQRFDRDRADRFIDYLTRDFYSYAEWQGDTRNHTALAKMSIARDIHYRTLRIPGLPQREFAPCVTNLRATILFDRYRHFAVQARQEQKKDEAEEPSQGLKNDLYKKTRKLLKAPRTFVSDALRKRLDR